MAKRKKQAEENNIVEYVTVKGAREHNLKNVDIRIPKEKLIVFTGVSGSGKSSLVFDTIYAEGQRRYVESLSSYARQFLERINKPDVDARLFINGNPYLSFNNYFRIYVCVCVCVCTCKYCRYRSFTTVKMQ